jgi:hypothetical protein
MPKAGLRSPGVALGASSGWRPEPCSSAPSPQTALHAGRDDLAVEAFRAAIDRGGRRQHDERQFYQSAALALAGRVEEARGVAAEALARAPHMTVARFRARALSEDPAYLAQRERLLHGLALAGVPG